MISKYILDKKKVVECSDNVKWGKFIASERHVGDETIGDVRISTVFLGIDHSFGMGKPQLFETMVFGGKHDEYQERCATWEEAEKQHAKVVKLVKEKT